MMGGASRGAGRLVRPWCFEIWGNDRSVITEKYRLTEEEKCGIDHG